MDATFVGKKIGQYVIEKPIGRGGMGSVYLGHHTGLDKKVAIKVLSKALMGTTQFVQRFLQEARIAAGLDHPNIVQVFDVGEIEDMYYIVMQYVEGKNLDEVVTARGKLTMGEALTVVRKCATALGFAHQHGIVHRDIKPANIMVGADGMVKVTDFGLSKSIHAGASLSQTGDIMGTPYFMSPEQAKGEKLDIRTDMYSLGATFYYLLSGRRVFDGDTPISVALKHITENPKSLREVDPSIPEDVCQIIQKMMAKDREQRYREMGEVVRALQAVQQTASTRTVVQSAPKAGSPAVPHRRKWIWVTVGAIGMLLILILASKFFSRKPVPAADVSGTATPSSPSPVVAQPKESPSKPAWVDQSQKILKEKSGKLADAMIHKKLADVLSLMDMEGRQRAGGILLIKKWVHKQFIETKEEDLAIEKVEVLNIDVHEALKRAVVTYRVTYRHEKYGWTSHNDPKIFWVYKEKDSEWYLTGKSEKD